MEALDEAARVCGKAEKTGSLSDTTAPDGGGAGSTEFSAPSGDGRGAEAAPSQARSGKGSNAAATAGTLCHNDASGSAATERATAEHPTPGGNMEADSRDAGDGEAAVAENLCSHDDTKDELPCLAGGSGETPADVDLCWVADETDASWDAEEICSDVELTTGDAAAGSAAEAEAAQIKTDTWFPPMRAIPRWRDGAMHHEPLAQGDYPRPSAGRRQPSYDDAGAASSNEPSAAGAKRRRVKLAYAPPPGRPPGADGAL